MEFLSYYANQKSTAKKDISILDYINFVKEGANQDLVIQGRAELAKNGKSDAYKLIKSQSNCVTGSAVMNPGNKNASNINKLNGLIVLDIDHDVDEGLKSKIEADKYTYISHRSFGGDGLCVFIKINPERFIESFNQLAQYYYTNFDVVVDEVCKNKNRLRYLSYDPELYYNEKAHTFKAKAENKKQPKILPIFTSQDDIHHILGQIVDRKIDLVKGEYERYRNIGFGFFAEFGEITGKQYFDVINQFNEKLNVKRYEKEWKSFCTPGAITIRTFYNYCKEFGIELFTPRSREIINRVKVQKAQGKASLPEINQSLSALGELPLSTAEAVFAEKLIQSPVDLSPEANKDLSEIEQIERFIIDTFAPKRDVITDIIYINNGKRLTDNEVNDIYISCKKNLNFSVPISDVRSILHSNSIGSFNSVTDFFNEHKHLTPSGIIDAYVRCIEPFNEYNVWAFKKWLVGAIHNWVAPEHEKLVCPLTLVLTGQKHGTGKTSFLRNCLPDELQRYFVEGKINAQDKDSQYLLGSSLMVLDDEFGGKAFKDVKEYKAISDINIITQRRPYASTISTFKRRAILCGTSNEVDILKDVTGNRRILPIAVNRIDFDAMLKIDKVELIMEAYNLYKDGFDWKIYSEKDVNYLAENTTDNNVVLPLEEIFFKTYSLEKVTKWDKEVILTQGDILEWFHKHTVLRPTKYEIKEIFTKNKMSYAAHWHEGKTKKGYKLYIMADDEPF
jgi:hypothetical protein